MKKLVNKFKKFWKKVVKNKKVKFFVKVLVVLKAVLEVVDVLLKLWDLMGPWFFKLLDLIAPWLHYLTTLATLICSPRGHRTLNPYTFVATN